MLSVGHVDWSNFSRQYRCTRRERPDDAAGEVRRAEAAGITNRVAERNDQRAGRRQFRRPFQYDRKRRPEAHHAQEHRRRNGAGCVTRRHGMRGQPL